MAACFIANDLLEKLPQASQVGQTRVGEVDFNQLRMRRVVQAVLAFSMAPRGFTASELSTKVHALGGTAPGEYGPRQAAYDLKKLRGKEMVCKRGQSHRYQTTPEGARSLTALWVLRDKAIKPLLASACQFKRGRPPQSRLGWISITTPSGTIAKLVPRAWHCSLANRQDSSHRVPLVAQYTGG
ncbi:MAG: hypothetical protein ACLQOO_22135 [Terriglobia bacterium]